MRTHAQALSRTHVLGFAGQGYQLLRATSLPFSTTLEQLLGRDAVERDPAASTSASATYASQLHRLDQHAASTGPGAPATSSAAATTGLSMHFVISGEHVSLSDAPPPAPPAAGAAADAEGEAAPRQAAAAAGTALGKQQGGGAAGRASNGPIRKRAGRGAAPSGEGLAADAGGSGAKDARHVSEAGAAAVATALKTGVPAGKPAAGPPPGFSAKSPMQLRQQLRAELRQLGGSFPAPGDKSRIPHSTFTPSGTHPTARHLPGDRPGVQAAAATRHLNLSSDVAASSTFITASDVGATLAQRQQLQQQQHNAFMSRTSAEAIQVGHPVCPALRSAVSRPMATFQSSSQWRLSIRRESIRVQTIPLGSAAHAPSPHHPAVHAETPYGPGTGPLADLPARQRAADVLFAGAAATAHLASSVVPFSSHTPPRSPTPTVHHQASPDPLLTEARGAHHLARAATAAALEAVAAAPHTAHRRDLLSPQPPEAAAALAAVAAATRAASPSRGAVDGALLRVSSPALRPVSPGRRSGGASPSRARVSSEAGRSSSPSPSAHGVQSAAAALASTHVASNHGLVPAKLLIQQQQQQAGKDGRDGTQGGGAAGVGGKAGGGVGGVAPPGQFVDKVTGLSSATIHQQAVRTWKDMGSTRAAEAYVTHLPPGILNVSFSTAGLPALPKLKR